MYIVASCKQGNLPSASLGSSTYDSRLLHLVWCCHSFTCIHEDTIVTSPVEREGIAEIPKSRVPRGGCSSIRRPGLY